MDEFAAAAEKACRRLLGVRKVRAETPPPNPYKRRQQASLRVELARRTVIATRRRNPRRARIETAVLAALAGQGAPVPGLLAHDEAWVIQEDAGRRRLSDVLHGAGEEAGAAHLDAAVAALIACQAAAHRAGLEREVAILGGHKRLLKGPEKMAAKLGLAPPFLAAGGLMRVLGAPSHHFIKWDTRPANAVLGDNGAVVWIDWEECGRGNRLRDLAWLLCDEWLPEWPDTEARIIAKYLGAFADGAAPEEATEYLAVLGTLQAISRLDALLGLKGDGPWWDEDACLAHELFGVTRANARRLSARAMRWAARSPLTSPLAPWLAGAAERLPED